MNTIDIILSSRNPSKVNQIKPVFAGLPVNILSLEEASILREAI